jgi:hypothetical protein
MTNSQDHNWHKLFDEAIAEKDLSQLLYRINAAETAMFMRMKRSLTHMAMKPNAKRFTRR